jgi:hypothetical protein
VLEIHTNMNSCVEEILGFKTCCGAQFIDQNLEILIRNIGSEEITVLSSFDLETTDGITQVRAIAPGKARTVSPGEVIAFYCRMDDAVWTKTRRLFFRDSRGRVHVAVVTHEPQGGPPHGNH